MTKNKKATKDASGVNPNSNHHPHDANVQHHHKKRGDSAAATSPGSALQLTIKLSVVALLMAVIAFFMSTMIDEPECLLSDFLEQQQQGQQHDDVTSDLSPFWSAEYNRTMVWGSYRPQVYFGMRTRAQKALLVGMVWQGSRGQQRVHHTAEEGDITFGWSVHDGVAYGDEHIHDPENALRMRVQWVKVMPKDGSGSPMWAVRVTGRRERAQGGVVRLGLYLADEAVGSMDVHTEEHTTTGRVFGETAETGRYEFRLRDVRSVHTSHPWGALVQHKKSEAWDLSPERLVAASQSRHHNVVLLLKDFGESDFVVEGTFAPPTSSFHDEAAQCALSRLFKRREAAFHDKFNRVFPMPDATNAERKMATAALSNLVGGVGYWHGDSLVAMKDGSTKRTASLPLVSAVPCRSKFPRGFMWDEGFHQMLIAKWLPELSKDIIMHWMLQMDDDGWIPREQIRGAEARTRVPSEFVPQHPTHANPPTLVLQVQAFARANVDGRHSEFLRLVWPYVQRWLKWFTKSQASPTLEGMYQWKGRKGYHLLSCGLDDYPRPQCRANATAHVDLFSWIGLFRSTVADIAKGLGEVELHDTLRKEYEAMAPYLEQVHWDPLRERYADLTGCKDAEKHHSRMVGYVTLFPLLTRAATNRTRVLATLREARTLMSGFGLQSLSNSSRKNLTRHDDYWTGPIWINLNYLLLRSLYLQYNDLVGDDALFKELRRDLIDTITKEYTRTGRLWENYDLRTGRGRGTSPFTGWTTLVVLILSNQYE
eukprot:PhM_4_TR17053/c0_g1_i1/m.18456/K01228/GCS1; mannosyl-oligosaccharide glucosidase